MNFTENHFRHALGNFATGVTIVSAVKDDGKAFGITASSFNVVSMNPPLVSWSIQNNSSNLAALTKDGVRYLIHVLTANQADLAMQFSRGIPTQRFNDQVNYHINDQGLPQLDEYQALFGCTLHSIQKAGDHHLIIGMVDHCDFTDAQPLLYFKGRFFNGTGDSVAKN